MGDRSDAPLLMPLPPETLVLRFVFSSIRVRGAFEQIQRETLRRQAKERRALLLKDPQISQWDWFKLLQEIQVQQNHQCSAIYIIPTSSYQEIEPADLWNLSANGNGCQLDTAVAHHQLLLIALQS